MSKSPYEEFRAFVAKVEELTGVYCAMPSSVDESQVNYDFRLAVLEEIRENYAAAMEMLDRPGFYRLVKGPLADAQALAKRLSDAATLIQLEAEALHRGERGQGGKDG